MAWGVDSEVGSEVNKEELALYLEQVVTVIS